MQIPVPAAIEAFQQQSWAGIEPRCRELLDRPLGPENVASWLADWTLASQLIAEVHTRLYAATILDTTDQEAEQRYYLFLEEIYPRAQAAEQELKQKLLESGLEPPGFEIPLRNLATEAALFREANLPLLTEELKLAAEYNRIVGAQTVEWEGEERTIPQLAPLFQEPDRAVRERAWRLASERQLADRERINELWGRLMAIRGQQAANAGCPDYRAFQWQRLLRFDYSPADCARFHEAIEEVVVPAATRIYERRREQLGLATLRPWDLELDLYARAIPPIRAFSDGEELEERGALIFRRVDPVLGGYFETMRQERLLDLTNRRGKGPGASCLSLEYSKRPFIFMNAVGLASDVNTLLHEAGHAFHVFETNHLPYFQQLEVPMEFAEVASMAMELLASPYLARKEGGFFDEREVARFRIEHLENILLFWPYMAIVDAFQHWVYENHEAATDPARCDEKWAELWQRFIPGIDWSGLEDARVTGWHRKRHIHRRPFYYVEYGLAQLGAVQVWRNALENQEAAVARYRQALALGGTVPLPELYGTAGARFAFDAATLRSAVELIEGTIGALLAR